MSGIASIFRIPVAKVTEAEAVERIVAMAQQRDPPRAAFVATLNVDFVCNAVRGWPFGGNDELWGYLKDASLVTADGIDTSFGCLRCGRKGYKHPRKHGTRVYSCRSRR